MSNVNYSLDFELNDNNFLSNLFGINDINIQIIEKINNVKIKYSSNIITCDNLDLIFNKNMANMYNNVFFKNDTSNAKADLINVNFLTGNINIKMYEEDNNIKINKN